MHDGPTNAGQCPKTVRADARRNIEALLKAAAEVFAVSGVDAPVRQITAKAGVGAGTLYRHFPQRSDLITAVFRHEVDACTEAAATLAAQHEPLEALTSWLRRFTGFIATKRGLSAALHSGNPAYENLPNYFDLQFVPALATLLEAAAETGEIRSDIDPEDLLRAVANLTLSDDDAHTQRMIALLTDGLRYGAQSTRFPGH